VTRPTIDVDIDEVLLDGSKITREQLMSDVMEELRRLRSGDYDNQAAAPSAARQIAQAICAQLPSEPGPP
jgi:polysaccharide deacetylase 2 family uncharacterized protein YibQ